MKLDTLMCLDKSSFTEGTTPFHEAAKADDHRIMEYLMRVFKKRNEILKTKVNIKE